MYRTKRLLKRLRRKLLNPGILRTRLSLGEVRRILVEELGLNQGDTILAHSSFGSLNADFTPDDLISLLQEIVGCQGLIMMPYYPPSDAISWLSRGAVFDVKNTPSSMGILTTRFARQENVVVSLHPVKAVAAWGSRAAEIINEHCHSLTPFDVNSPYARLLRYSSAKSIGIGIERCTFFHSCEDLLLEKEDLDHLYLKGVFTGKVKDTVGTVHQVATRLHNPKVMKRRPLSGHVLRETGCPSYKRVVHERCVFYSVPIDTLFEHMKNMWRR